MQTTDTTVKVRRFLYLEVRAFVDQEVLSFAHCFVEAYTLDSAYELGAVQLEAAAAISGTSHTEGSFLNDYVVELV